MILFSHSALAPDSARAGGACLNGLYSVAGMQLLGYDANLHARKSWFMFDSEIVCLGSDIHQNRREEVLTVVENRITGAPWHTARRYAWLDRVAGYYFPESDSFTAAVSDNGCRELTISHGVAPTDGHYAYVLLPGFTLRETKRYACRPETRIIAHTAAVHAVAKPRLQLTAYVFFEAAHAPGLSSDGPACVLMQRSGDSVILAVSDPTWQRPSVTLTLDGYEPVVVNTADAMGQTITVTLPKK
jgi:hyaluronate lyase